MTAKLSRLFQTLHLAAVRTTARPVEVRSRCGIERHVRWSIVLFAVLTFTPTRVAASIQCPLPLLKQTVISAIGAHDEIFWPVVRSDVIPVMDFLSAFQIPPQRTFNYENVLRNSTASACARVIGCVLSNVIVPVSPDAAPPCWMDFTESSLKSRRVRPDRVTEAKEQRFPFTFDSPTPVLRPLAKRSCESTTALTKTRRIQQSRAPIVCAENAFNLTHTGGIRG